MPLLNKYLHVVSKIIFQEMHLNCWQIRDCPVSAHDVICPCCGGGGGGGQISKQICKKNSQYKLDYDCVTLCESINFGITTILVNLPCSFHLNNQQIWQISDFGRLRAQFLHVNTHQIWQSESTCTKFMSKAQVVDLVLLASTQQKFY